MAILPAAPGLVAEICVDNQPLEEYEDDDELEVEPGPAGEYQASRTVSKYIKSTSDKEFFIRVTVQPGYVFDCSGLEVRLEIDGKMAQGADFIIRPKPHELRSKRLRTSKVTEVDGIRIGTAVGSKQAFLKRFLFAKIETSGSVFF